MRHDKPDTNFTDAITNVNLRQRDTGAPLFLDPLTQPDCVLPSQYFANRASTPVEGEIRLLIAVLQDAMNIYARTRGRKTRAQVEQFAEVRACLKLPASTDYTDSRVFAKSSVSSLAGCAAGSSPGSRMARPRNSLPPHPAGGIRAAADGGLIWAGHARRVSKNAAAAMREEERSSRPGRIGRWNLHSPWQQSMLENTVEADAGNGALCAPFFYRRKSHA